MKTLSTFLLGFWVMSESLGAEPGTKVVVWKAQRKLQVISPQGQALGTYKIALGGTPVGPKRCEGDQKTPEGTYTLGWINEKSRFYRSIHVSYPSAADRARSKKLKCPPGGDIFVHGIGPGGGAGASHVLHDWTLGCIAVTNAEIDEIISLLKLPASIHIHP